jgi:FkbM family methyltransferase
MAKIFLDVGGHVGQTLDEILSGKYTFDKVYCFEPMPREYTYLVENYTQKGLDYGIEIINSGLLDKTYNDTIYGTNEDMAASIYQEKYDVNNREHETLCSFISAAEFFHNNIKQEDLVTVKLNCEGSEIRIVNSLIESGEISKVSNMMLDFDIRKVPGKEHQAEELIQRLEGLNFKNYSLEWEVMIGDTHQNRIGNWLSTLPYYSSILR